MKNQRGFTLLELMVAVAMIAIVASMAMPSWREFVANRRTAGASRDIYNTLMHTRMLAIKEGETVTMIYKDGTSPVSGASANALKTFTSIDLVWDRDDDGIGDTQVIYNVPGNVTCKTTKNTMGYNSRGIVLGTNAGKLESSNVYTSRVYRVVVNSLGSLRQESES